MDRIVHNSIWVDTGTKNMREHTAMNQWPLPRRLLAPAGTIERLLRRILRLLKTECIRTTVFQTAPFKILADVGHDVAAENLRRFRVTLGALQKLGTALQHKNRAAGP